MFNIFLLRRCRTLLFIPQGLPRKGLSPSHCCKAVEHSLCMAWDGRLFSRKNLVEHSINPQGQTEMQNLCSISGTSPTWEAPLAKKHPSSLGRLQSLGLSSHRPAPEQGPSLNWSKYDPNCTCEHDPSIQGAITQHDPERYIGH